MEASGVSHLLFCLPKVFLAWVTGSLGDWLPPEDKPPSAEKLTSTGTGNEEQNGWALVEALEHSRVDKRFSRATRVNSPGNTDWNPEGFLQKVENSFWRNNLNLGRKDWCTSHSMFMRRRKSRKQRGLGCDSRCVGRALWLLYQLGFQLAEETEIRIWIFFLIKCTVW